MKRIYLCGPISGTDYETCAMGWRKDVHDVLVQDGHEVYSPMRGKSFLANAGELHNQAYDLPIGTAQGIIGRDRNDTITANLLFCNLLGAPRVSIGSMVELGWADIQRIPIIVCMEPVGNCHDHLFVKGLATYLVHDVPSGIALARMLLSPGL